MSCYWALHDGVGRFEDNAILNTSEHTNAREKIRDVDPPVIFVLSYRSASGANRTAAQSDLQLRESRYARHNTAKSIT